MLPFNGIHGRYRHGYKAAPTISSYFDAVRSVQQSFLGNTTYSFATARGMQKQRSDKWRHENKENAPLLGPTLGWVEVRISDIETITAEELSCALENSHQRFSPLPAPVDPDAPLFRTATTQQRTFQLEFRTQALQLWGGRCAVTGVGKLLEAAHIQSVEACKMLGDHAALCDPFNSVILNVALHSLLDAGYIAFSDTGNVLMSSQLTPEERLAFGLTNLRPLTFHPAAIKYVRYHREQRFQSA